MHYEQIGMFEGSHQQESGMGYPFAQPAEIDRRAAGGYRESVMERQWAS